jgi:hypothetical protein
VLQQWELRLMLGQAVVTTGPIKMLENILTFVSLKEVHKIKA